MEDTPVYLVTGFLESGKTKFIQETLQDKKFFSDGENENVLVISFEEGEEELDPSLFASPNVFYELIEDKEDMTPEKLIILQKRHNASKILVEYNGMWQLGDLFENAPENWIIGQQILFFDAGTFQSYNANMRSLVVDKIQTADMIIFNRITDSMDPMEFHKAVRGLSRQATIIYEKVTGEIAYDEIEDPLPFDKDADIIVIEDRDYALFYRDLCENMNDYDGKKVRFKAVVCTDPALGTGAMFVGRHVMTCCVEDIRFSPMICKWGRSDDFSNYDWATVEGTLRLKHHKAYNGIGPVLFADKVEKTVQPEDPVAVFY